MALRELRKEKGILAKKIAEHLGITYRQYHRIESGEVEFDMDKAQKLSKILGTNIKQIEKAWEGNAYEPNNKARVDL